MSGLINLQRCKSGLCPQKAIELSCIILYCLQRWKGGLCPQKKGACVKAPLELRIAGSMKKIYAIIKLKKQYICN